MNKDELRAALQQHVASVKFTKVDGSERDMKCTLLSEHLPAEEAAKGVRPDNPNVLAVWDLEKNEWRSFRVDSVQNVNLLTD